MTILYSFASWQQFISRTLANWARNDDVLIVLLYVLNDCRTATNVWRKIYVYKQCRAAPEVNCVIGDGKMKIARLLAPLATNVDSRLSLYINLYDQSFQRQSVTSPLP